MAQKERKHRYDLQDFIKDAKAVHGDYYDYSESVYRTKDTDIRIICPEHGPFMQRVRYHLQGHGCPHKECKERKREATMVARYGVRNPMDNPEFKARHDATMMEKYGAVTPFESDAVREKIIGTMELMYGGRSAMCDEHVREKAKVTNQSRYGHGNAMQSDSVKEKQKETLRQNHGVDNPMRLREFVERQQFSSQETMLSRYGVKDAFSVPAFRDKAEATNLAKYGFANAMQSDGVKRKNYDVRREHGTLSSSKPEDDLYGLLCNMFGQGDVERQYCSDVYPWACDFYIRSRNLYMELNASWVHGGHWFDKDNESDADLLVSWNKEASDGHPYYGAAAKVWSVMDCKKCRAARDGKLNYVVFWDADLRDAAVWFSMGCPDGHDYDGKYTWLPERHLSDYEPLCRLRPTSGCISRYAKHYQFKEFYKREIATWEANEDYRGLPLQMYLYWNRLKYIDKVPDELTDIDIARGFKIAGIIYGYSGFDIRLMDEVVKKYGITSVYDPCAGWGERELYCYTKGITYLGNDINPGLAAGYSRMESEFFMGEQHVYIRDSTDYVCPAGYDATITCPPYGSLEVYTERGAENLSETDFLSWWKKIVDNTTSRYFCFQINQKWKDRMDEVVQDGGFRFLEEMSYSSNRASHFNRKKDGKVLKREYESMMVYERI